MTKILDDADKAALLAAGGASLVPLFLQSYIPGGPFGIFIACVGLGFAVYKIIDMIF
jgi:hypothetical protein